MWTTEGLWNLVYSGFALRMVFVFLVEQKMGRKIFLEFIQVLLEMRTYNVISCSYCFPFPCQSLGNLGNFQHGFTFCMNQQILMLKEFILIAIILYYLS